MFKIRIYDIVLDEEFKTRKECQKVFNVFVVEMMSKGYI